MSTVWIDNFDAGMHTTLQGELIDVQVDGDIRKQYAIDFRAFTTRVDHNGNKTKRDFNVRGPDAYSGKVPIYFVAGSPPFTPKIYPCIVIRRLGFSPAMQNGGQAWGIEYKRPASDAVMRTVTFPDGSQRTGPSKLEIKPPARPYDITYDIDIRARGDSAQQVSNRMYQALSRIIEPPGFTMTLLDSENLERRYDALVEGVSPNLEVLDLTGRDARWTISVIVHGEMDHVDPYDVPALTGLPTTTMTQI